MKDIYQLARRLGKPKAQPNTRQLHGLYRPMLGCATLTQPLSGGKGLTSNDKTYQKVA